MKKYDVFISYRREVSTQHAFALRKSLESIQRFKDRIFMDTHTLKSGNFVEKLNTKIRESCNFVTIFSEGCFDNNKKEAGKMDYFLYEISQALKYGINVIPIYYDEVKFEHIKDYLNEDGLIDFPKQNSISFHNDDPDGSVNLIISFLKSEEDVLKERYADLAKEKREVRDDLLFLQKSNSELRCPICNNSYSAIQSYCQICGYKFYDDLECSVAETSEQLQEIERKQKHKDIWKKYSQQETCKYDDKKINKLQAELSSLKKSLESANEEFAHKEKEYKKTITAFNHTIDSLKEFQKQREREYSIIEKNKEQLQKEVLTLNKKNSVLEKELAEERRKAEEKRLAEERKREAERNAEEERKRRKDEEWAKEKTFTVGGVPFKMIRVEGGNMGTFYIGETQVTQKLWQAVMGNNPSFFKEQDHPVEDVSWYDICGKDGTGTDPNCFLYKLNQETGKKFRLPTEEEWEYAAKGGNKSKNYTYAGSNDIDKVAWYWNSSDNYLNGSDNYWSWETIKKNNNKTHPVKQLSPNELDIYDMSGNVWEWCQNLYDPKSSNRVLRGGSGLSCAMNCRVDSRYNISPDKCYFNFGFRLVLVLQ